jgi:hypothetical protein
MTSARRLKREWVSIRVHGSPVSALSVGLGYGSKLCALQAAGLCFVGSPNEVSSNKASLAWGAGPSLPVAPTERARKGDEDHVCFARIESHSSGLSEKTPRPVPPPREQFVRSFQSRLTSVGKIRNPANTSPALNGTPAWFGRSSVSGLVPSRKVLWWKSKANSAIAILNPKNPTARSEPRKFTSSRYSLSTVPKRHIPTRYLVRILPATTIRHYETYRESVRAECGHSPLRCFHLTAWKAGR